jgi:hypothetical protein
MKLQFKKREEFNKEFKQEGFILLYENRLEFGPHIEQLAKEMVRKSKLRLTDILGNGVQLVYAKDKENIYFTENRKMDLERLASKYSHYLELLKKTFENK